MKKWIISLIKKFTKDEDVIIGIERDRYTATVNVLEADILRRSGCSWPWADVNELGIRLNNASPEHSIYGVIVEWDMQRESIQRLNSEIKKLKEENEALKSVAYGTCPPDLWDETFNRLFPDAQKNKVGQ